MTKYQIVDGTPRSTPWLCSHCGYMMDAASHIHGDDAAIPKDGDLCICINCGTPYTLDGDAWRRLTTTDLTSLTPVERRELELAQTARDFANLPDLTKRDPHDRHQ
jgi:hypothetical protein